MQRRKTAYDCASNSSRPSFIFICHVLCQVSPRYDDCVFGRWRNYLCQSRSTFELLQYRPSHAKDFKKILTEADYKRLKRAFNRTLRGKSVKIDIERLQHQGQNLSLVLTFIPIKNDDNYSEGLYLIIEDMSTYSAMKHQLMLHEKHLNYAQHIAAVGSWEYFIQHDKLYCSDNFYHIFGFTRSDNDGIDHVFQFIHPDDYERTYDAFNHARKGTNFDSDFRIYHGKTNELRFYKLPPKSFGRMTSPLR